MEPLTLAVGIATLDAVDELAAVAARTFPLACPPSTPADNIASFIDTNLTATRFAEYLADPRHAVLTARHDDRIVGYAMLIRGDPDDPVPPTPPSCPSCTCCPTITVPAWRRR